MNPFVLILVFLAPQGSGSGTAAMQMEFQSQQSCERIGQIASIALSLLNTTSGSIHDEVRRGSASRRCYRTAE
jgi:hypothetical protein